MKPELIARIKGRGYWRINFQPLVHKQKIATLTECKDIVERNAINLKGWDYPHFPRRNDDDSGLEPFDTHYLGWVDWCNHIEFWHMYQSGQFLHYLALKEDWLEHDLWDPDQAKTIKPMSSLGLIRATYNITEFYLFLERLAATGIYEEGVRVSISLCGTKGRGLWIEDPSRGRFYEEYKASLDKIVFLEEYAKDVVLSSPKELALKTELHFLERFGWEKPNVSAIQGDQDRLISGRF